MRRVVSFWLAMIRSPFRSDEFFRINRAQLGSLPKDEKDELWAALSEDEKRQIKDAMRDEHE
jgi:hypothetical protein